MTEKEKSKIIGSLPDNIKRAYWDYRYKEAYQMQILMFGKPEHLKTPKEREYDKKYKFSGLSSVINSANSIDCRGN
jgi:hypothetical protein